MLEPRRPSRASGDPTLARPAARPWTSRLLPLGWSLCAALALAGCGDDAPRPPADVADAPDSASPDVEDTLLPDIAPELTFVLTQLSPSEGRSSGLEEVTLVGRGLARVVQVTFGDAVAVDPFPINDGLLVALTPPNPRGTYDVTVVNDLGERYTLPAAFKYVEPVSVDGIEPASGSALGGERALIRGAGFSPDAVVLLGSRRAVETRYIDPTTLEIVTPEGAAGRVDVHVSSAGGAGRLRRGFEYLPSALPLASFRVDRVTPASGPAAGGTRVTLDGVGFTQGLAVHIGALPATSVRVLSATRIEATTAKGSPGPATVRVIGGGAMDAVPDAFEYTDAPALWVVSPPTGSIAGGTRVRLIGSGFPAQGEVLIGGKPARDLAFISDSEIMATTPGGFVGAVSVTIRSPELDTPLTRPDAFVYYDPAANPGTWGEPIDGTLNVTVLDARAGTPVPGAFVMLGASPSTRYRGYADNNGQITFSGDDLLGDQTVTASFTGYQTFALGGFDAENVTVPLEKAMACADIADMPCDTIVPPPVSAVVRVHVVGSDKGPTIPFGACADWTDAAGGLCATCVEDEECGGGADLCRELGSEGTFCTTACEADTDCDSGFVCLDPTGLERERRCVPPPGIPTTYCDVTEDSLTANQQFSYPGNWVPPSDRVQFLARLGDFAVYCWSGVEVRGAFRPHALGVTRGLGAYRDGEIVEVDVRVDIPLGRLVTIELERPTMGAVRDELASLKVGLNLNADGYIEFPPHLAFTPRTFTLNVPSISAERLSDARWDLYAEVTVSAINGGSALRESGLPRLDHELDYTLDGDTWRPFVGPLSETRGLATWREESGTETVLAVGERGQILKRFGTTWALMPTNLGGTMAPELLSVATYPADGPTRVAIVGGRAGLALHWGGLRWERAETGVVAPIEAITFDEAGVAWAVAGRDVLRYDGVWSKAARADRPLRAVVASGVSIFVAGEAGLLAEVLDGAVVARPSGTAADLHALTIHEGSLYAAGDGGVIVSGPPGGPLSPENSGTERDLRALISHHDTLRAAGSRATLLARGPEGWRDQTPTASKGTIRALAVMGDEVLAMGSHEFVVGPMLGIPENLSPGPFSALSRLTWQARGDAAAHFTTIEFDAETGPCAACGMLFMLPYIGWRTVLDGDLFEADFPELRGIANTGTQQTGMRTMTMYRVRTEEGFDFDHTATSGFYGGVWKAWSWRTEAYLR